MAKKRYRPLDDFNESITDTETDQLQNLDFNNPIRKRRREVTPERVVETQEEAAALGRVLSAQRSAAVAGAAFRNPNNPLISDEYYTEGGLEYRPLEEPGDFTNFWDLTFGTAQEIHTDAIRGHMFRTETQIDAILKTADSEDTPEKREAKRQELLESEEVLELLEDNKEYEEDLLEYIESSERNMKSVSDLYYAKAAAGQKEEDTKTKDYIGSAEMAQDLGGALSDIAYMSAGVAFSTLAASAPTIGTGVTAATSFTGPLAPVFGGIAAGLAFGIGTVGAVGSQVEMRANESAAEMYTSYKERYNTLKDNFTAENNGEQLSEDQLVAIDRMAKEGSEAMYQQDMALVASDLAQIGIAAVPWSSYLRLGKIPFMAKKWSDRAKKLGKVGLIMGAEATLEGHEEAYQYLTKEQYKLGMYDDYDETDFPFLRAMVNAPHIGKEAAIGMVDMYAHRSANGLTNTEEFRNSTRAGMALGFGMGAFMGATVQPITTGLVDKAQRMSLGTELDELGISFGNSSWEENLDIEQVSYKVNGLANSLENNRGANILKAFRIFQEDQEKAGNPNDINFDKLRSSLKSTIDIYNMHKKANPSLSNQDLINITKGHEYLNHYIEKAENNIETFTEQQLNKQQSEKFQNAFEGKNSMLKSAHNLALEIQAVEKLLENNNKVKKEAKKLGRFSSESLEKLMIENNTEKLNKELEAKKGILNDLTERLSPEEKKEFEEIATGEDNSIIDAALNKIGAEISLDFLKGLRAPIANPKKSGDILNNPFVKDVAKNEENAKKAKENHDENKKEYEESVETDESEVKEGDKAWFQGFPFEYMGRAGENYLLKPLSKTGGAIIEVGKDIYRGLRKLVSIPKTRSDIKETVNEQHNNSVDNSDTQKGKKSSEEYNNRKKKNQQATDQDEVQVRPGTEPVVKPGDQFTLFQEEQIDEGYRDFVNISIDKNQFDSPLYKFFHERSKEQVEALEVTYEVDRSSLPRGKFKTLWAGPSTKSTLIKYLRDNREEASSLLDSQKGIKIKVIVKDLTTNESEESSLIGINSTSTNEEVNNIIDTFGAILQQTPTSIKEATPIKGKIIHTNYGTFNNKTILENEEEVPVKNNLNTLKDDGINSELLFAWQNEDQIILGDGNDIQATLTNQGQIGGIYVLYRHITEGQKVIGTPALLNKRNLSEKESSVVFDIYKKLLFSKIGDTDSEFTFKTDYEAKGFDNLSARQVLNFLLEKTIGTGFNKAKNILEGVEKFEIDKERLDSFTRRGIKFTTGKHSRLVFGDNFIERREGRYTAELYNSEDKKITSYVKTGSKWVKVTEDLALDGKRTVNEDSINQISEEQAFKELEKAFNIFSKQYVRHQVPGTVLNDSIFSLKGFQLKDSIEYFGRTIEKGTESAVYSDMMIQGNNPVLTTDVEKVGAKGKQKIQKNRQIVVSSTDIQSEPKKTTTKKKDSTTTQQTSDTTTAPTTENLNKPFVTVRDGSGKMVSVSTETTEKNGVKKTKFKSETTTKKGKPVTQTNKSYNTFEELVEDIGIDLNREENESALELVETVQKIQGDGVSVKVLEIREDTNKSSAFYGTRSATIRIGSENIEILLKSQPTQQTSEVEAQVDPDNVVKKGGVLGRRSRNRKQPMAVTPELEKELPLIDIEDARTYLDRVLGSAVPVRVKEGLLRVGKKGTKAYGYFVDGAITLSKMGRASVEYHEALHAVEDLYLTPRQIESLNKETVKTYGEPTQESISVIMEDRGVNQEAARQYILSEYRAEEFRAYELEIVDMSDLSDKLKFWYDTVKDYIMSIFKGLQSKKLYYKISQGKYAEQAEEADLNVYRLESENLTVSQQEQNLDDFGINEVDRFNIAKSLFYNYVKLSTEVINEEDNLQLVTVRNLEDINKYFDKESFENVILDAIEDAQENNNEDQVATLEIIKDNLDVFVSKDLTGLIPEFLNSLSVSYNTEEEYLDAQDSNDDLRSIKAPYEFNSLDGATVSTKLLFQLLPQKDESNNIILDPKTGLPTIVNGNSVYTTMQKIVSNVDHIYNNENVFVTGFDQMKEKIELASNSFPAFKGFATEILDSLTEQQKSQFYRVMNMKDYNFISILESSYSRVNYDRQTGQTETITTKTVRPVNAALQSLKYRLKTKWFENYKRELFRLGKEDEIIVKNPEFLKETLKEFAEKITKKVNKLSIENIKEIESFLGDLSTSLSRIGIKVSKQALINYSNSYKEGPKQAIVDLVKGKGKKPGVQYLFLIGKTGKTKKYKYSIRHLLNNIDENGIVLNDFNLDSENTIGNYSYTLGVLADIASFAEENTTGSTINVDNKTYWTHALPNFIFNVVDRIQASKKELSNILEDRWSKGSRYLQDTEGLEIATFANVRDVNSGKEGKDYANLVDREFYASSINKMFAESGRVINFPTFADKSTWYMLKGATIYEDEFAGDFVKFNKESGLVEITRTSNNAKNVSNLMSSYIIEEAERIAQVEADLKTLDDTQLTETFHYTRDNEDGTHDRTSARGLKMILFKNLNNDEILKEVGLKNEDNTWTINKNISEIKTKLQPYVLDVLENNIRRDIDAAVKNNIIKEKTYEHLLAEESPIDSKVKKIYANNAVKLITAFSVNSTISYIETTKMFSGDPAYYKNDEDLTKRIVSIIAPGHSRNLTKESFYRVAVLKDFELNSAALVRNYSEFLKSKDYTDSEIKRMLKAYAEVDVTDGQAYITLERWRDIMIDLGDIDRTVIEEAYERLNDPKGKPTVEDVSLVMAQPLKGMAFTRRDSEVHGKSEQIPTYTKYSQAVLIPAFVENKADIGELLKAMKRDKVDEAIFLSGIKAGALSPTAIVDQNGKLLKSEDISFNIMTLNNRDWKLQQPLSPHKTSEQLEGSQPKKNILANVKLLEDYKVPYSYKDSKGRWKTGTRKVKGYQLVEEFHLIDRALSDMEFETLKEEWGIEGDAFMGYSIRDVEALKKALERDFAKDDAVADKILKLLSLKTTKSGDNIIKEFAIDFDNNPFDDVIERKLASILTKRLVKLKMPGGSFIQTSAFGMTKPQRFTELTKKEQTELREQMFPFNKLNAAMWDKETGKAKGAQIFLPNYMKKLIPNNVFNNKSELQKYIKDNRLLEATGYRIPNQGIASIDALEVVGFLPQAYGDTVIAYDEITAKTGSDFDIDKMYIMLPSFSYVYEKDENGKNTDVVKDVRYINFEGSSEDALENIEANIGTRNSKKALRNRKLELYRSLLLDENTFADLINPLDSVDTRNNSTLVRYLENKNNLTEEDIAVIDSLYSVDENGDYAYEGAFYKTVSAAIEKSKPDLDWYTFASQMQIRKVYLGGKMGVGQEARHIVDAGISQHSPSWKRNGLESPYYFAGLDFGIGNITPEGSTDLSQARILNSKVAITTVLSARLDGYVDIAKDPYIFYINNNYLTANTVALMDRVGTDPQWTDMFMSLPIIKEYVEITQNITSGNIPKLTITENGKKVPKNFYKAENYITRRLQEEINERLSEDKKKEDVTDIRAKSLSNPKSRRELLEMLRNTTVNEDQRVLVEDIYSKQYLAKLIDSTKDEYSVAELRSMLGFLKYFMDIKKHATTLNEAVTASKYDTQGARGGFSQARIFENLYTKLTDASVPLKGFAERFEGTMAGKYREMGPVLMKELFGNMFLLGNDTYYGVLETIAKATKHSKDILENEEFIRNMHRNFRSFIYTETDYFKSINIQNLLYGPNNISVRLAKAQEDISNIKNNPFINYLTAESKSTFDGFPYIIAPAKVAKSGKDKNVLTKAWGDLLAHPNSNVRKLAEDLYKFSIIASGFRNGMFTFHELVPLDFEIETGIYDQFGEIANDIKENGDINNEYATKFLMSQKNNPDLVPEVDNNVIQNVYNIKKGKNDAFIIGIADRFKYKLEVKPLKVDKGGVIVGSFAPKIVAYPEYVPFVSMIEGKDQVRRLYEFAGLDNLGTEAEPKFIPIYNLIDSYNYSGKARRVYEPVTEKGTSVLQNIKQVPVQTKNSEGEIIEKREVSVFNDPIAKKTRELIDTTLKKAVKITLEEIEEINTESFAAAPWNTTFTNIPSVDEAVDLPTIYEGNVLSPAFKLKNPITTFVDSTIREFNSIQEAVDNGVTVTDAVQLAAKYNTELQAELENISPEISFIESMDNNYGIPGYGIAVKRAKLLAESGVIGYQELKNEEGDTYFINTKEVNMFLEELSPAIESKEYLKLLKDMMNPVLEQSGIEILTVVSPEARKFLQARKIKGAFIEEGPSNEGIIVMQETANKEEMAETLLHELLHKGTLKESINDPVFRNKVVSLINLYMESSSYNQITPQGLRTVLEKYKSDLNTTNTTTAISEFISYGMTNSVVVAQLKKLKVKAEEGKTTSLFDKLVDLVLNVFGYTKENTDLTAYDLLSETVGAYIAQGPNLTQGKKFREDAILSILKNAKSPIKKALKVAINKQSTVLKILSTEINKKCN